MKMTTMAEIYTKMIILTIKNNISKTEVLRVREHVRDNPCALWGIVRKDIESRKMRHSR